MTKARIVGRQDQEGDLHTSLLSALGEFWFHESDSSAATLSSCYLAFSISGEKTVQVWVSLAFRLVSDAGARLLTAELPIIAASRSVFRAWPWAETKCSHGPRHIVHIASLSSTGASCLVIHHPLSHIARNRNLGHIPRRSRHRAADRGKCMGGARSGEKCKTSGTQGISFGSEMLASSEFRAVSTRYGDQVWPTLCTNARRGAGTAGFRALLVRRRNRSWNGHMAELALSICGAFPLIFLGTLPSSPTRP